ncbi:hypothetical protein L0Z38_00010 [Burkholderia multivorans]|uniref:hypothetical protein n=1 Tax=Burkholderia multivorans TaxID=87883 RepID=UPI00207C89FD|nr:hypothetical protein [Burkholderia multivorans]MCO1386232.1 hypothetical protein [Burkholderia multivorans]
MLIPIHQYAEACAAMHLCATPTLAAEVLHCSPMPHPPRCAMLFRTVCFAACCCPVSAIRRFINRPPRQQAWTRNTRRNSSAQASTRRNAGAGLLRAGLIAQDHHAHTFLTVETARAQCEIHAIPMRGYDEPLLSHTTAGLHRAHVCIAPQAALKSRPGLIERAILRWSAWLQDGGLELRFATLAGRPADALQSVLSEYQPPSSGAAQELAALDAHIAADRTGAARIQFASRRAELAAAAELEPATALPWLQTTVTEVRV